jgi:hypothetical protein
MIYLPIYLPSNNRWRRPDVVPSASKHNYRVKPHAYESEPKYNPSSLTDLDMQVIYEVYRAGWEPYYEKNQDIHTSNYLGSYGAQILPYLYYYRYKP